MEVRIGAAHPRTGVAHGLGIEVDDLGGRVHARIGAAGGGDFYGGIGEPGESRLEMILDAAAAGLRLPTAERSAVILDA